MPNMKILLQDGPAGKVRYMDVAPEAPIATLIPTLRQALHLPETDLFGNTLVYILRHSLNGQRISDTTSLRAAGVQPGTRIILDAQVLNEVVDDVELSGTQPTYASSTLHSDVTMSDAEAFGVLQDRYTAAMAAPTAPRKKIRNRGRRAFFMAAGVLLAAGGAGVGYAAYQTFMLDGAQLNTMSMQLFSGAKPKVPAVVPPKPLIPQTATKTLTFAKHGKLVRTVVWSPNGMQLLSGADDAHVLLWNINGALQRDILHPGAVRALAWSPDSTKFVSAANNQVAFYNTATGANLALSTQAHMLMVTDLVWSSHGQMQVVSTGRDKRAVVWDPNTYRVLTTYGRHTAAINAASWAADGQTIATSSEGGYIRVWKAANAQDLHGYYADGQVPMQTVAFAPSGMQMAVGGDDGMVRFWNALTCGNGGNQCMDLPQRVQASKQPVRALAWSPDGRFLAVGADDGLFTLWMPGQNQNPLFMLQQNDAIYSITWSPDGKQFALASGTTVTLWQVM